jgi:hypothetical protein
VGSSASPRTGAAPRVSQLPRAFSWSRLLVNSALPPIWGRHLGRGSRRRVVSSAVTLRRGGCGIRVPALRAPLALTSRARLAASRHRDRGRSGA